MIFLSEWLHEDQLAINVSISSQLNDLADQVKESLRLKNPTHMLFSVSSEIFKKWRSKNLLDNKFNFEETQEILDCQCELFNGLNYSVDHEKTPKKFDIHKVFICLFIVENLKFSVIFLCFRCSRTKLELGKWFTRFSRVLHADWAFVAHWCTFPRERQSRQ